MATKQIGKALPKAVLTSLLAGIAITILTAILATTLISMEKLSDNSADILCMVAIVLGSATTAIITAGKLEGSRLVTSLIGGLAYILLLICCGALFFDGVHSGVGPTALVCMAVSGAVGLLGHRGKKSKYKVPKLKK